MAKVEHCAVCGEVETALGMSRVVVEGRALTLCREHASTVASAMPETFDDLRGLFVGTSLDRTPSEERRSPIPRRADDDRRVFPPRLEGRRASSGRRATDVER